MHMYAYHTYIHFPPIPVISLVLAKATPGRWGEFIASVGVDSLLN